MQALLFCSPQGLYSLLMLPQAIADDFFNFLIRQCPEGERPRPLQNSFERLLWAFWGTHRAAVSGPREWANRELFEALRLSFRDLANKA